MLNGRGGTMFGVRMIEFWTSSLGVQRLVRLVAARVMQLFLSRLTTVRPAELTQLGWNVRVVCTELRMLHVRPCNRHGAPFGVFTFLQLAVMMVHLVLMRGRVTAA